MLLVLLLGGRDDYVLIFLNQTSVLVLAEILYFSICLVNSEYYAYLPLVDPSLIHGHSKMFLLLFSLLSLV